MVTTTPRHKRLAALERAVRTLAKAMPEVVALKVQNALLVATVARLVGENDRLREHVEILKARRV